MIRSDVKHLITFGGLGCMISASLILILGEDFGIRESFGTFLLFVIGLCMVIGGTN